MFQSPVGSESSNSDPSVSPLSAHSGMLGPSDFLQRSDLQNMSGFCASARGTPAATRHNRSTASSSATGGGGGGTARTGMAVMKHYDPSEVFGFLAEKKSGKTTSAPSGCATPSAAADGGAPTSRPGASAASSIASKDTSKSFPGGHVVPHYSRLSNTAAARSQNPFDSERSLPLNLSAIAHGDTLVNPASPEQVISRLLQLQKRQSTASVGSPSARRDRVGSSGGAQTKSKEEKWAEHVENQRKLRAAHIAKVAEDIEYMRLYRKMAREQKQRDEAQRIAEAQARSTTRNSRSSSASAAAAAAGGKVSRSASATGEPANGAASHRPQHRDRSPHSSPTKRGLLTAGDIQAYFETPAYQKKLKLLPANPVLGGGAAATAGGRTSQSGSAKSGIAATGRGGIAVSQPKLLGALEDVPASKWDLHFARAAQKFT